MSAIEAPSGKGAADENFPVGSVLMPRALRPHVAVFYRFARAADDIADSPDLAAEDKVARLAAFDAAVAEGTGDPAAVGKALALRASLLETGVPLSHARDLLAAFTQDATKT
ncbi:MAG: squalene/phytoene synthase family protein, partial [Rhodospirillaceae bacterium]|nr:squalene/phytoene synthase family protein [Rhodospirillaceae bacterium]